MKPLHIAAFVPGYRAMTGGPKRTLSLLAGLSAHGHTISAIVPSVESEFYRAAQSAGIRTHAMPVDPILTAGGFEVARAKNLHLVIPALVRANTRLSSLLRHLRPDVLWIRGSKPYPMSAGAAWKTRTPLHWDIDYEPESRGVVRAIHTLGLRHASCISFQHRGAPVEIFGEALYLRYRHKMITVLPGLDVWPKLRARHRVGRSGPLRVAQVATITPRKNQRFSLALLRMASEASEGHGLELSLIGDVHDSHYHAELRAFVAESGLAKQVRFLGWQQDVPRFLALHADVLLQPSLDEGIPNAVQEAMAVGLPVIASDRGGHPDLLDNSQRGWALPLSDTRAWVNVLTQLSQSPSLREAVGERARRFAREHFDHGVWINTYSRVLAGDCREAGAQAR